MFARALLPFAFPLLIVPSGLSDAAAGAMGDTLDILSIDDRGLLELRLSFFPSLFANTSRREARAVEPWWGSSTGCVEDDASGNGARTPAKIVR